MSFDGLMFRRMTSLLQNIGTGSFINKISQVNGTDFIFALYKDRKLNNLYVSTNNMSSFFAFIEKVEKFDNLSNHFLSILYHHIVNGYIKEIEQINNDRILRFTILKKDELGLSHKLYMYVELIGKLTNIILVKEDGIIIDALHKVSPLSNRGIVSGITYELPTKPLKNPLTDYDKNLSLGAQFNCFSKNLLDELNYRIEKGEKYEDIIESIMTSEKVYIYPKDYHLIPLKHCGEYIQEADLNEGIINYNLSKTKNIENDEVRELSKIINRQIKHLTSKIQKLTTELKNSDNAYLYQEYGDLIFTYVENLDEKKNSIIIDQDGNYQEIKLDDTLSIKENALKFYKKYQKLRNSKEMISEQIHIANDNLEYYKFLSIQLENKDKNNVEQIKDELIEQKIIKVQTNKRKNQTASFLEYQYDGYKIYVGKNNYQNETLTLKKAKYDDYFFHVKDYAGSHVIVQGSKDLNESIIRFAANLAAYYSTCRESSSVPVDYTTIKYVKRHPSNIPGKVTLKNYKTIYIDPEKPKEK